MAEQESKDKPKLLDRLRQKRQGRKQRAAERANRRRGTTGPDDQRRDSGAINTDFGGGM